MTFEWSWVSGEAPAGWKLGNVVPIFKKCKKDELGNYRKSRPVSVPSITGKIM